MNTEELELLTVVFGENPAQNLLTAYGSARAISLTPVLEIAAFLNGDYTFTLFEPRFIEIVFAAMKLGRIATANKFKDFTKAQDVYDAYGPLMAALPHEEFWVLALDAKNKLLKRYVASSGSVTECEVSPAKVFAEALRLGAAGLIVMHNHPSGDPAPSPQDDAITKRLMEAGNNLDLRLLDHLIIGREGAYYSYAQSGRANVWRCA